MLMFRGDAPFLRFAPRCLLAVSQLLNLGCLNVNARLEYTDFMLDFWGNREMRAKCEKNADTIRAKYEQKALFLKVTIHKYDVVFCRCCDIHTLPLKTSHYIFWSYIAVSIELIFVLQAFATHTWAFLWHTFVRTLIFCFESWDGHSLKLVSGTEVRQESPILSVANPAKIGGHALLLSNVRSPIQYRLISQTWGIKAVTLLKCRFEHAKVHNMLCV